MRLKVVLFVNIVCLPIFAQRDFSLVRDRNALLSSGNAAALVTFADSSISKGSVAYRHENGDLRLPSQGRQRNVISADVSSYMRVSPKLVTFGHVSYINDYGTEMSGSMLFPTSELKPFDLIGSAEDAGSKRAEIINIMGAAGWNVWRKLSVGAKLDYTSGSYAKYKDLRHTNSLMNLYSRADIFYNLSDNNGIGLGFIYRRQTESLRFKTFGTTDVVHTTILDYANGYGETETFGVDGFTDGGQEQPLFSEYTGLSANTKIGPVTLGMTYLHRHGYYGRNTQYAVLYENHSGEQWAYSARMDLLNNHNALLWIDMQLQTVRLSSYRTNYRRVTSQDNSSLTFYEYYEPTKMSDKAQWFGKMNISGYWEPEGSIYMWFAVVGADYFHNKQTAYLYPEIYTSTSHILSPFADIKHSFLFKDKSLLSFNVGGSACFGMQRQWHTKLKASYEIPIRHSDIRPNVSLRYDYHKSMGDDLFKGIRNMFTVELGATF
ncbi:MAG: DUF6850 family outer membrane beta-barrel protein [Prevotella sp.]